MATNTSRLGLLKKDTATDGNDTFNIKTMLNDNWDKIDAKVATLGADGKVPTAQLPSLNYVPTSEKGAANGVATLGADGKVPASQLSVSSNASGVAITDAGDYYTSANVEGALQELGQAFSGARGNLVTSTNGILGS